MIVRKYENRASVLLIHYFLRKKKKKTRIETAMFSPRTHKNGFDPGIMGPINRYKQSLSGPSAHPSEFNGPFPTFSSVPIDSQ